MKYSLPFIFLYLLFSISSFSQNFKGRVTNSHKEPIAGSTVYIQENKQGLICNTDGEFQTTLPAGNYHCLFSCIGYETQTKEISIRKDVLSDFLEITLKDKITELQEVVVNNSGEDPAYAIMRKAIEKAPFYLSQVKEYTSEVYIKGSGKATEIPKMIEKLAGMAGEDIAIYKDKLFLQESFSEIKFTEPDKYVQHVKAFSSTMPNDSIPEEAFGAATASLYSPMFLSFVSPLNPKAFSYYKFRYEGYDEEDGIAINKIKVIPRLKDPKFMEGYLYIADEYWNIRHVELAARPPMADILYTIHYSKVDEGVYLVTAFDAQTKANIMGLKFTFNYSSSVKYTHILLNDSLIAAQTVKKAPEKKKEKKSLEIKRNEKYKHESDSLATKRDSTYWDSIRNIALNTEELQSYVRKDTIQAYVDSVKQVNLHPRFQWGDILSGGRFGGDSSKVYFKYDGILEANPEYNFVDGLWLGESVELGIQRNRNSWFKINPRAYWALSRERLLWNVDAEYTYAPMRLGKLSISTGSISEDYISDKGMLRIENALYSLFMGVNNAKFYQKDYLKIENEIDLANGLKLSILTEAAKRTSLDNHTTYSFFGKKEDAKPNIPPYPGDLNGSYENLLKYRIGLRYTPEYYYYVRNGKKQYSRSRFPTFQVEFQNGIPYDSNYSRFYRLDLGVSQSIKLGLFDYLRYGVIAGKFLNTNQFNYIDYKHFNSADQLVTGKMFEFSYELLPYYTYSTADKWVQAFATYNTKYLALKRLPFLQGKMFSESLHGKYLWTPDKKNYSEWGYAVGIPGLGSIGTFVSFDGLDYNSWGVSISVPLLQMTGIQK